MKRSGRGVLRIQDIAEHCGVSKATVSAVLAGKPGPSAETRDRILSIARSEGYSPNLIAVSLAKRSSRLIGLVVKDILNPFYTKLIQGINTVVHAAHYNMIYHTSDENHERELQCLQMLGAYQVDGIIIAPVQKRVNLSHLSQLADTGPPCVSLGKIPGVDMSYVDCDDEQVGYIATAYLLSLGYRRIYNLAGPRTALSAEQRLDGYRKAMAEHAVEFVKSRVLEAGAVFDDGYRVAKKVFLNRGALKKELPIAILCYNDLMAFGVYKAASEAGLRIPEDVAVVGCDDIDFASISNPPLTTVSQSIFEMGKLAAEILFTSIRAKEKGKHRTSSITCAPKLVVRNSTMPARVVAPETHAVGDPVSDFAHDRAPEPFDL
jgi:DNA-binding LacI/PurR family transcriptional regulator